MIRPLDHHFALFLIHDGNFFSDLPSCVFGVIKFSLIRYWSPLRNVSSLVFLSAHALTLVFIQSGTFSSTLGVAVVVFGNVNQNMFDSPDESNAS